MESAQVRSTGDTTFLLEQHTPEPTPLEEKQAPMIESNPIEAANAQITAPSTTGPADQHSTAATNQTAHTPTTDSATTDSTPIKTTTNVYHTDSDNQKPAESAEPTEHTESAKRAEPATASTDKADTTSTSRPDARSSYRPGSKALDLPPPVTSSSSKSNMDDSASSYRSTKDASRTGPPLPVTTSASELYRTSPPLPVTTSASDVLPVCPDPTAHRDTRLQEQASNAALYVTKTGKTTRQKEDVLDANNKLSSRSMFRIFASSFSTLLTIPRRCHFAQVCKP
jgi:hypothetical protein